MLLNPAGEFLPFARADDEESRLLFEHGHEPKAKHVATEMSRDGFPDLGGEVAFPGRTVGRLLVRWERDRTCEEAHDGGRPALRRGHDGLLARRPSRPAPLASSATSSIVKARSLLVMSGLSPEATRPSAAARGARDRPERITSMPSGRESTSQSRSAADSPAAISCMLSSDEEKRLIRTIDGADDRAHDVDAEVFLGARRARPPPPAALRGGWPRASWSAKTSGTLLDASSVSQQTR